MELVIKGKVWRNGSWERTEIGIRGGKMAALGTGLHGDRVMDFGDSIVLPGSVDPHVHLREPGSYEGIDFYTETRGALLAGVTTVIDMPNNVPPTVGEAAYMSKVERARGRVFVNVGFNLLVRDGADLVQSIVPAGYKVYLGPSTGKHTFDWRAAEGLAGLSRVKERPVFVHAEEPSLFADSEPGNLAEWNAHRPVEAERAAVRRFASAVSGCTVHFCHVTSVDCLPPSRFSCEATYHHLLLDCEEDAPRNKVLPPLRPLEERMRLWEAFARGDVLVLASDHAPHPLGRKDVDFPSAASGIPSLGAGFPVMMHKAVDGQLDMSRLLDAACARPGELLGLKKGRLEVGYDADIAVFEPEAVSTVPEGGLSGCGWTPFAGWKALYPHSVFIGGKLAVSDGEVVAPPMGQVLA